MESRQNSKKHRALSSPMMVDSASSTDKPMMLNVSTQTDLCEMVSGPFIANVSNRILHPEEQPNAHEIILNDIDNQLTNATATGSESTSPTPGPSSSTKYKIVSNEGGEINLEPILFEYSVTDDSSDDANNEAKVKNIIKVEYNQNKLEENKFESKNNFVILKNQSPTDNERSSSSPEGVSSSKVQLSPLSMRNVLPCNANNTPQRIIINATDTVKIEKNEKRKKQSIRERNQNVENMENAIRLPPKKARKTSNTSRAEPVPSTSKECDISTTFDQESDVDFMIIGPNQTKVPSELYNSIDPKSLTVTVATRKLLKFLFTREVLATHTLTGKPSPAFHDRNMPTKSRLNPLIIGDIIYMVTMKYNVPERDVRCAITTKCADENKMLKQRLERQQKKGHDKENVEDS